MGRHFRVGKNKIIVGRNENENQFLTKQKRSNELQFELADVVGPTTILQGSKTKKAIETAARITAFYSDAQTEKAKVNFGKKTWINS